MASVVVVVVRAVCFDARDRRWFTSCDEVKQQKASTSCPRRLTVSWCGQLESAAGDSLPKSQAGLVFHRGLGARGGRCAVSRFRRSIGDEACRR